MKLISVLTACFNEEENVRELYTQVKAVFKDFSQYSYEHIFIDNASTDKTVAIIKSIAAQDKNVKLIVNTRNFGHIRSPFYGLLQCYGDAVISIVADLQDPPVLIRDFIKKWEEGYKVVVGVKQQSRESQIMFFLRKCYYHFISKISEIKLIKNFTGFGLYDKVVIDALRKINDPYPYFRGLISELGFEITTISYVQPVRKHGVTKNNLYTLYDMAILGITSHSKLPIRLLTFIGFALSFVSFFTALVFVTMKLISWQRFGAGMAPMLIGLFFFSSIQLFFIGMIGEYIGSINTRTLNRPLVVEKERVNFT